MSLALQRRLFLLISTEDELNFKRKKCAWKACTLQTIASFCVTTFTNQIKSTSLASILANLALVLFTHPQST